MQEKQVENNADCTLLEVLFQWPFLTKGGQGPPRLTPATVLMRADIRLSEGRDILFLFHSI